MSASCDLPQQGQNTRRRVLLTGRPLLHLMLLLLLFLRFVSLSLGG
jgi:hypothetical protein